MQNLIEVVKVDGVPVTVEEAAQYLGILPTSVVYRVVNFTKSSYQGHTLERCEINEEKAAKVIKKDTDEAILQEKSQKEETKHMTIREVLKEKANTVVSMIKRTRNGRTVICEQDGEKYKSAKDLSRKVSQAYPTIIAYLGGVDKRYVDPDTKKTYVFEEYFNGIKPLSAEKVTREHHIIQCKETGDILIGLTRAYKHSGGKIEKGNNHGTHLMLNILKTKGEYIGKNGYHYVKLKANDSKTFCALHSLPEKYDDRTILCLETGKTSKDARTVCRQFGINEATFGYHLNKNGKFVLKDKKLTFVNIKKYINLLLEKDGMVIEVSKKSLTQNVSQPKAEVKKEQKTFVSNTSKDVDMKVECLKCFKEGLDKFSEAIDMLLQMEKMN